MKPFSPDDVKVERVKTFSPDVVDAINKLLVRKSTGSSSISFTQDEAIDAISVATGYSRDQIFDKHLLDFEDVYRAVGWKVEYDKPAYNETYNANFKFTRKRND